MWQLNPPESRVYKICQKRFKPKTSRNRGKTVKRAFTGFTAMEMLKLAFFWRRRRRSQPRLPSSAQGRPYLRPPVRRPSVGDGHGHARLRLRAAAALFPDRPRPMARSEGSSPGVARRQGAAPTLLLQLHGRAGCRRGTGTGTGTGTAPGWRGARSRPAPVPTSGGAPRPAPPGGARRSGPAGGVYHFPRGGACGPLLAGALTDSGSLPWRLGGG